MNDSLAKKVAKNLNPEVEYTVAQITDEIVNAGEARMATRQVKEVAARLREMGFVVNESWFMGYEQFLFESTVTDRKPNEAQDKAIKALNAEMNWNPHKVSVPSQDDLKTYDYVKNFTLETGLVYWGMAGQSLVKDIKTALKDHDIDATVNRGYEITRASDEHDYVIVIKDAIQGARGAIMGDKTGILK